MSSTRLPGKVLRPLAGSPMVLRQVERIIRMKLPVAADHTGQPDPQRPQGERAAEAREAANDRNASRDARRPPGKKPRGGNGFGKPAFGAKPEGGKPQGQKPFRGGNKRRFGGKRPAARAA